MHIAIQITRVIHFVVSGGLLCRGGKQGRQSVVYGVIVHKIIGLEEHMLYPILYVSMWPYKQERPYHDDSTASRLLSEVKHHRARLVLRWGTTLESRALFFCHPLSFCLFPCSSPCFCSFHSFYFFSFVSYCCFLLSCLISYFLLLHSHMHSCITLTLHLLFLSTFTITQWLEEVLWVGCTTHHNCCAGAMANGEGLLSPFLSYRVVQLQ